MEDDRKGQPGGLSPANDNIPETGEAESGDDSAPSRKMDRLVLGLASLIGRQMARDDFERLMKSAANDNERRRRRWRWGDRGLTL
ncbi:hypothetical protein [Agrobacterium sp. T29]|uniref:hypothetical protein n=1 Tax=Agrobacterium sp. T29 TaxID=2580515 RepID=UPI00115F41E4|nr:hypothetical protein [Agrobacterium sp. T29]